MNQDYAAFLAGKAVRAKERGLTIMPKLATHLFPFQRHCVEFALRTGCSGLFLDTGLGKSEIQLEWCHQLMRATGHRALILTPLAVAGQFARRADRWGYNAQVIRDQSQSAPDVINICNYDRLDKLDLASYGIVSLDEASILKSFTGKTTRRLIEAFKGAPYKLAATATPAPNDHMEIGNYAEFLDVMAGNEMLSRFFINDTSTASQEWRLKRHAETAFWDWMSSWARMAERPADLGDMKTDPQFVLPPFEIHRAQADASEINHDFGSLFGAVEMSATSMHQVKRQTSKQRARQVADIVNASTEAWIIWVDTNYEADEIMPLIAGAVEVRGSMDADDKEVALEAFATGKTRVLLTKPSVAGFGMDWSHCARMIFAGRSYSYETWYQAVRRCWRFGQHRTVHVHLVVAEGEDTIGRVIDRKSEDHAEMKMAMRKAMVRANGTKSTVKKAYNPTSIGSFAPWISAA